jgi:iron(III) transport system ATP-binding protein
MNIMSSTEKNSATTSLAAEPIEIAHLWLAFVETQVLKGIDLSIEPGEFFAFLGPSGSGKSTLLRAIAGFGPHPRGAIHIGGHQVTGLQPWQRNVGMVFQNYALWPHMTVAQNVAYGLEERRVPRSERAQRVEQALKLVGLVHLAARYPSQLSGGQQQRVAWARTIVIEPQVLLLDEPLSNLDANLRVQMRQDLLKLQRRLGITTIFVTHDQEEANAICDRIAVLADGVVQQIGRPDELYDNPKNPFVARFLGSANMLEGRIARQDGRAVFVLADGHAIGAVRADFEGPAVLVFRPQFVSVTSLGAPVPEDEIHFSAKIVSAEFLGHTLRYRAEVWGTSVLLDEMHLRGGTRRQPGDTVLCRLPRDQATLLRNEP